MINHLPTGVYITTPSGRLAKVMYYDSEDRIHVRYMDDPEGRTNDQACFPGKLAVPVAHH